MKSPLLQEPLPVMRKPLPDIFIIKDGLRQPYLLEVDGLGKKPIPRMVAEAIEELNQYGMWEAIACECIGKMRQPGVTPRPDVAVLALMLRYNELNYVEFTKC